MYYTRREHTTVFFTERERAKDRERDKNEEKSTISSHLKKIIPQRNADAWKIYCNIFLLLVVNLDAARTCNAHVRKVAAAADAASGEKEEECYMQV